MKELNYGSWLPLGAFIEEFNLQFRGFSYATSVSDRGYGSSVPIAIIGTHKDLLFIPIFQLPTKVKLKHHTFQFEITGYELGKDGLPIALKVNEGWSPRELKFINKKSRNEYKQKIAPIEKIYDAVLLHTSGGKE